MVTEVFFRKIKNKINSAERCGTSVYYKCQWEGGSRAGASLGYAIYRWLHLCLLLSALLLSLLSKDQGLPGRWPIFLTNWALLLYLTQASLAVRIVTPAYVAAKKGEPIKESTKLLEVYSALHSTSVVIALGVTVIYWSFVYDPEIHQMDLVNVTVHAINSVIMIVDLALVSQPVKLKNIIYPPLFTLVYTVFNVIYYLCGGTDRKGNHYVYKVLSWNTPISASLFVLGGIFLLVILFIIIWCLTVLRRQIGIRLKATVRDTMPPQDTTLDLPLA